MTVVSYPGSSNSKSPSPAGNAKVSASSSFTVNEPVTGSMFSSHAGSVGSSSHGSGAVPSSHAGSVGSSSHGSGSVPSSHAGSVGSSSQGSSAPSSPDEA